MPDNLLTTQIERLKEDDSDRTMFSSAVANEAIDRINMMLRGRCIWPLQMTWSDAGPVWSIDKTFLSSSFNPNQNQEPTQQNTGSNQTGSFSGSIQWKGQWKSNVSYSKFDVVRKNTVEDYKAGAYYVGSWICVKECIGGIEPTQDDNENWEVFSPIPHYLYKLGNGYGNQITLDTMIENQQDKAKIVVEQTAGVKESSVTIDINDTAGKEIKLNPVTGCENGQPASRIFLDSTTSL